ncbi:GNAT family N-acetyltransferase [Thalassospira indica]|uniref:N-acetyltransferase n=1 Tax=Thalassospira indica TaxID=1891279 RepID=A0ABM6XZT9_9PROT|nr:GNAT family N-acetyltransferase [Thalassospira indica]AXO15239.1 N-acetyltransferase [Thalassospira indica]OAZ08701.1 acetyltransferase [Thalassospira profundimaris]
MHLRDATRDDMAEILEIYNQVLRDSTAIYDDTPSTLEARHAWFAERQEKGFPVLVVEDDGRIVGFGSYGPWRARWGYRFTVEHSVHVHIDHRGTGVGGMLVRALIGHAKQAGMHVMVGGIDAENVNSIRFHERLGFVEVGRAQQVARKFDRWLDLVTMQLFLDDASVSA